MGKKCIELFGKKEDEVSDAMKKLAVKKCTLNFDSTNFAYDQAINAGEENIMALELKIANGGADAIQELLKERAKLEQLNTDKDALGTLKAEFV